MTGTLFRALYRLADARVPARPVALARMAVGVGTLLQVLPSGGALYRLMDPAYVTIPYAYGTPPLSYAGWLVFCGVWIVSAVLFALGLWTRVAGGVLVAVLTSLLFVDQQTYTNKVYLFAIEALFLTVAGAGAALSLDARRQGTRATVSAWPVFLVMAQISIVYVFTAVSKVNGEFLGGDVMLATSRPLRWLAESVSWRLAVALAAGAAWGTIVLELALAAWPWRPRWRGLAFAAGFVLHVGITLSMRPHLELAAFTLSTVGCYVLFVDARERSRVVTLAHDAPLHAVRLVARLERLDWFRALDVRRAGEDDDRVMDDHVMQRAVLAVRGPTGQATGSEAVLQLLDVLPATFLWAWLLRLPGVRRAVARRWDVDAVAPPGAANAGASHASLAVAPDVPVEHLHRAPWGDRAPDATSRRALPSAAARSPASSSSTSAPADGADSHLGR